jgi:cold shock CspA family protein
LNTDVVSSNKPYEDPTITGHLKFYDAPSAWGLILGEDDRLYVVRGDQLIEPLPLTGQKVAFEPHKTRTGLRALGVRRIA